MSRKLYVVLPIYNEDQVLEIVLKKIAQVSQSMNLKIIVVAVNDGSTDDSLKILESLQSKYSIEIVNHQINRGLGETIRDGFESTALLAGDDDLIVRFDADDTHDPDYISSMVSAIDSGLDVVIASRFQKGGGQKGVPSNRAWISSLANIFFKTFYHLKNVDEYTCGFRMYRASIIKKALAFYGNDFIQLKNLGFCCTVEKLLKLNLLGARIGEVPFVLRYDQKMGSSKMVFNTTTAGYLFMVILYHWPWGGWKSHAKSQLVK